jgi:hypothetical protein
MQSPILTDSDLDYVLFGETDAISHDEIDKHLYIVDKTDTLIPYQPNRIQQDLETKLTGRDLIVKYRQGGVSTYFVGRNFKKAITQRARIGTMAHDDDTTQKLRRMANVFWQNLPDDIRPLRGLDNASTTTYKNTGSEITIATAGNTAVGRGGTYGGGFHGSEVAYWKDAKQTLTGILQGVPLHAPIALESTTNGAQGHFFELCMAAMRGEGVWSIHFYQWWWEDEYRLSYEVYQELIPQASSEPEPYTEEEQHLADKHGLVAEQIYWRRYKQSELGDKFLQEYPEDIETCFLQSGNGVFSFLPDTFTAPKATYNPEHQYVMGIDWGQSDDFTDARIFDVTDYCEVASLHLNKLSYESMIDSIAKLAFEWHVEKIMPERNSMGAAIEMLSAALNKLEWPIDPRTRYPSNPTIQSFWTDIRSKDRVVKLFQAGIEAGLKLLADPIANQELRAFISLQKSSGLWSYDHPVGGKSDTVIARLLAHYACYELKA